LTLDNGIDSEISSGVVDAGNDDEVAADDEEISIGTDTVWLVGDVGDEDGADELVVGEAVDDISGEDEATSVVVAAVVVVVVVEVDNVEDIEADV
jgi:hypothetical protein